MSRISASESDAPPGPWFECYPPDYDHGGAPLLGEDPAHWGDLLDNVAFFAADCDMDGRVIVVVATVVDGFVEVRGQLVNQGEPLFPEIGDALRKATHRITVDRDASDGLGLDVELEPANMDEDWQTVARRIELDLLSTIASCAVAGVDAAKVQRMVKPTPRTKRQG